MSVENSTIFAPSRRALMELVQALNISGDTPLSSFFEPPLDAYTLPALQYAGAPGHIMQ